MRALLAVLVACSVVAALPGSADARKRSSRHGYVRPPVYYYGPPPGYRAYGPPPGAYQAPYPRGNSRGDSETCVEARSLDPGGNYSSYPCWAQKALAPKTIK